MNKRCTRCGETKPHSEFYPRARSKDGLRAECKVCKQAERSAGYTDAEKERNRTYSRSNAAKRAATSREFRQRNAEQVRAYMAENRDRYLGHARLRKLLLEHRMPGWANQDDIKQAYALAVVLSRGGVQFQVDHIVPLRHALVSGLHCESNLRVIPRHENASKGNRHWPDMP